MQVLGLKGRVDKSQGRLQADKSWFCLSLAGPRNCIHGEYQADLCSGGSGVGPTSRTRKVQGKRREIVLGALHASPGISLILDNDLDLAGRISQGLGST